LALHTLHTQDDDLDLVAQYRETHDVEVIGVLYQRYLHLVYGVCLKYLKDRQLSQDAVVQIFEKLMVDLPNKQINNFKPWLYVVTKNHCLMELRRMKSGARQDKDFQENALLFMESEPEMHPLDAQQGEELTDALYDCINRLKQEQRDCIERFYLKEKCYQEISEELDIDLNKVKSYIQNGKRNLKICLESKQQIGQMI
jgi:RNA polymerase sigma-70 factor (ECF subfamily)